MDEDAATLIGGTPRDGGGKVRLFTMGDLDGRTLAAKRVRELADDIAEDLGGSNLLSASAKQLIQRASVMSAICEHLEAQWAQGIAIETGSYLAVINALRRVLLSLGLERRARDVTVPDPIAYARRASEE